MQWIVQLGFELEIYQTDELGPMYWDLQRLASYHIGHLDRIRSFVTRSFSDTLGKGETVISARTTEEFGNSLSFLHLALVETSATQSMAEGLHCVRSLSLIQEPSQCIKSC
jgi:hypothetical protein